jgi:hypothetical protein
MKKYFVFITLVLICSLAFIQCQKKCDSKKLGDIRFTQTDLNIVPYVGTENLIFKDSIGDSISEHPEVAAGRISHYDNHYYEHYFSQDQCPPNYYDVEQNYTHFEGEDYNTSIWTDLYFENPFVTPIKKYIVINVAYEDSQRWYFTSNFYFDSFTLYDRSYSAANIVAFNDSIKIGPKLFFKVYTLRQNVDPHGLKNLQIVYYSINRGVVGFKTDHGHLWYLALSF